MTYPPNHKEVVESLMDGKFITIDDALFLTIKGNPDFYPEFFMESFGIELKETPDFYYLISEETKENTSRDICIFFTVLAYEMDKAGKNFLEELNYSVFGVEELMDYLKGSSWAEVVEANRQLNTEENFRKFLNNTLVRRNIAVRHPNERYTFTRAHKFFLDYARDLIREERGDVE
ncbi:MAG: hypothetical protein LUF04_14890 [Bacteroides sp.]|nr:hypothetical protein [Bacteroides sp.]